MSAVINLTAVQKLEDYLLQLPQADIETVHTFLPGKYERKIFIPPWTVLTGAEHRTDYVVRLEQGSIAVNTDKGIEIFQAPIEFVAHAGIKRAGRVFDEPVTWVDIYDNPDNCTDLKILEERLYVVPNCGLGENRVAAKLERDRSDYRLFLSQLRLTQEIMDTIVQNETDVIPIPEKYEVEVRSSRIHGRGLFALRKFSPGEHICPGRLDGRRTYAGRFTNHSCIPNAVPIKIDNDDIHAVAIKLIHENEEILINYRDSMRENFGIEMEDEILCLAG